MAGFVRSAFRHAPFIQPKGRRVSGRAELFRESTRTEHRRRLRRGAERLPAVMRRFARLWQFKEIQRSLQSDLGSLPVELFPLGLEEPVMGPRVLMHKKLSIKSVHRIFSGF